MKSFIVALLLAGASANNQIKCSKYYNYCSKEMKVGQSLAYNFADDKLTDGNN